LNQRTPALRRRADNLEPDEQQVGIESLEPQNNFWGIDLSDDFEAKRDTQTLMTVLSRGSTL
jgi:hypothetical protein